MRCEKINIDGSVCGARPGKCIHDWKPTRFGVQTRVGHADLGQPRRLKALLAKVAELGRPFRRSR